MFLGARSQQNLNQAASRIRASGGSADTFIIDVLDEQSTAEQVMQCKQGLIPEKYSPQKRSQWG
ncbi:short chain dehydrogenase [compost metagenome]